MVLFQTVSLFCLCVWFVAWCCFLFLFVAGVVCLGVCVVVFGACACVCSVCVPCSVCVFDVLVGVSTVLCVV